MSRGGRSGARQQGGGIEVLLFAGIALLASGTAIVWLAGNLASLLGGSGTLGVGPTDAASVLKNLPGNIDDLARAWPATVRGDLPGQATMIVALVVSIVVVLAIVMGVIWLLLRLQRTRKPEEGAEWATGAGPARAARQDGRARPPGARPPRPAAPRRRTARVSDDRRAVAVQQDDRVRDPGDPRVGRPRPGHVGQGRPGPRHDRRALAASATPGSSIRPGRPVCRPRRGHRSRRRRRGRARGAQPRGCSSSARTTATRPMSASGARRPPGTSRRCCSRRRRRS